MAERHWHVIPSTAPLCWLNLGVGAVLLVSSVLTLTKTDLAIPAATVVAGVAAVALIVLATIGLVRPRLRGR